jgi:hypothetical protein
VGTFKDIGERDGRIDGSQRLCHYSPMPQAPFDFQVVRRIAITALFSDDVLFDKVVLKGGNALNLALGISDRTSLDLDFP